MKSAPPQAALTYAEAQMRIDDPGQEDNVTKSLRSLNKLAKILKQRRIENGWVCASISLATHDDKLIWFFFSVL